MPIVNATIRHHLPDPKKPIPEDAEVRVISASGPTYEAARDEVRSQVPPGWQILAFDTERY